MIKREKHVFENQNLVILYYNKSLRGLIALAE